MTNRASVRREARIDAGADGVWAVVGDPTRLAEWFPGVASCTDDLVADLRAGEPPAHEPRLLLEAPV